MTKANWKKSIWKVKCKRDCERKVSLTWTVVISVDSSVDINVDSSIDVNVDSSTDSR